MSYIQILRPLESTGHLQKDSSLPKSEKGVEYYTKLSGRGLKTPYPMMQMQWTSPRGAAMDSFLDSAVGGNIRLLSDLLRSLHRQEKVLCGQVFVANCLYYT